MVSTVVEWALDTGVGKYKDADLYALEITTQTLIK